MKILLLVNFAFFCQIFNSSNAVEKDGYDEFEIISAALEEYSDLNDSILRYYLQREFIIKRYTDTQLRNADKIREALLRCIFPAYSRNGTNNKSVESDCINKLDEEEFISKENFTSYFNGYLVKVDNTWKIRKIEDNLISYLKIESSNIMELLEFMDAFGYRILNTEEYDYKRMKTLALIQIKYQIKSDSSINGGKMTKSQKELWEKYNLGSDLIQKACNLEYVFDDFLPNNTENKLYFGIDGDKQTFYKFSKNLGKNLTFADIFDDIQMGWLSYYGHLEGTSRNSSRNSIQKFMEEKLREIGLNENVEKEAEEIIEEENIKNVKSATNVSNAEEGNFYFYYIIHLFLMN